MNTAQLTGSKTVAGVKAALEAAGLYADQVTKHRGEFTVRVGYYYRSCDGAKVISALVPVVFPSAVVTDSGEVWKPFVGGAPVARQSHYYVKFTFTR